MQYFSVAYFLVSYPCWNEYVTNSANQWKFQRYVHSRDTQLHTVLGNYCATVNLNIHLNKELLNALGGFFMCVCVSHFACNSWKLIEINMCAREQS